ncbi:MAG: hypothetical protein ACR2KW_03805 [Rubrobacter sp.]
MDGSGTTELIQFIGAMIFFAGILFGSYWFVYAPVKRENQEREAREEREKRSSSASQ